MALKIFVLLFLVFSHSLFAVNKGVTNNFSITVLPSLPFDLKAQIQNLINNNNYYNILVGSCASNFYTRLDFKCIPMPNVNSINYVHVDSNEVSKSFSINLTNLYIESSPFNRKLLLENLSALQNQLISNRYYACQYALKGTFQKESNSLDLDISYSVGPQTYAYDFLIKGNYSFSNFTIANLLHCLAPEKLIIDYDLLGYLEDSLILTHYNPQKLIDDQEAIKEFYLKNGYLAAAVKIVPLQRVGSERLKVEIIIDEGPQAKVGQIVWVQNVLAANQIKYLDKLLSKYKVFSADLLTEINQKITEYLADNNQENLSLSLATEAAAQNSLESPTYDIFITVENRPKTNGTLPILAKYYQNPLLAY